MRLPALLLCLTAPLAAQSPRIVYDSIHADLSVMASLTYHTRKEQTRCVTRWRMERNEGRMTITLLALGPGEYAYSDSLGLWFYPTRVPWDTTLKPRVCGDSLPDVHSHIAENGTLDRPSERDLEVAAQHPAPFRLLLSVLDSTRMKVLAYGIRGRP